MERLIFTRSLDINKNQIKNRTIECRFITAYEHIYYNWHFRIHHNYCQMAPLYPVDRFELYAHDNPSRFLVKDSSCKFILKRTGHPLMECTVIGRTVVDSYNPSFAIPYEHPLFKFFESFFEDPKKTSGVLQLILDLPKNAFLINTWPMQVKLPPVGWEKDKRYKILTVEDKHDLHIVCKDGVFYTKKRDLMRNSNDFKKMFQEDEEWKDKHTVKWDICLETMNIVATYALTGTFLPPIQKTPERFMEIYSAMQGICEKSFLDDLDVYACRCLAETKPSLYDLVVNWIPTFQDCSSRLEEVLNSFTLLNYYMEITQEYPKDAKFTDERKKDLHKRLHSGKNDSDLLSLHDFFLQMHDLTLKVVVAEVAQEKKD